MPAGVDATPALSGRADGLRRAGRSASVLALGEGVNKLTRFAATVVLARALSVSEFGLVNVGIALSGVLLTLTAFGLPELGARALATRDTDARRIAGLVVVTRLTALAVVSAVAVAATAFASPSNAGLVALAALMGAGLSGSADWLLRGREQMSDVAVANGLGGAIVLIGCATAVVVQPTVTVALLVFSAGESAAALMTWRRARVGRLRRPTRVETLEAVRTAWPLGASGLIIYASYANLDTILLAAVRSEEEAGQYSGPYRLFLAANAASLFAAYALLPILTRAHRAGRSQDARALLLRVFRPLAAYGALVLGVAEALGRPVLTTLFGEAFGAAEPVFVVLCIGLPWYAIGFPAGYGLIAEGRNRDFLKGALVTGLLNLLLMVLLIPPYGTIGAAIATATALTAGGLTWLHQAGVLRRAGDTCGALVLVTGGGILVARSPELGTLIGSVTCGGALAMFVVAAADHRRGRAGLGLLGRD